jgi:hypothetical protein
MSTFLDIATDAVTEINQLGTGQTLNPEGANQAQRVFNRMIFKWSAKRLYLYDTPKINVPLSNGVQSYTLGPSGVFVQTRPTMIQAAQISLPGSSYTPSLSILDSAKWAAIRDKGATCSANGLPQDIWPEMSYPNITLWLWTIPANNAILYLDIWNQLQQINTLFDELSFPPGYEEAIVHNLAAELCPFYDIPQVPPSVAALAADGLASIQQFNAQNIGGALGTSQTLAEPNTGIPAPTGPAGGQ